MKKTVLTVLTAALLAVLLLSLPAHAKEEAQAKAKSESGRTILIVAFGTSVDKARASYANVEKQVKAAFPGHEVRWAWTAHSLLKSGAEARLSPQEALAKLATEGVKEASVLSLHIIPGAEYNNLVKYVEAFEGLPKGLEKIWLAPPLLYDPESVAEVAARLAKSLPKGRTADEAVLFVGHGTRHPAGVYYPALQYYVSALDKNIFIGTVEGDLDLEKITAELKARGIKKAWLAPLMTVAGDHALNDLFGPEKDSWRQTLLENGVQTESVDMGLGERPDFVALWIEGLKKSLATRRRPH